MAALSTAEPEVRMGLGSAEADACLKGGLTMQGLHEFYPADMKDATALNGFALLIAAMRQRHHGCAIIWAREARAAREDGYPYGPGLAELGMDACVMTLLLLPDAKAILRATLDAARDAAVSAVIIELAGRQPLLDLTATRRLALAAAEKDTMVLLVRSRSGPTPSAAHTRWQVTAAPSRRLEANAPGPPAFALTLLRQRGGRDGIDIVLEWDRDTASFRLVDGLGHVAPLSRPQLALAGGGASGAQRNRAA